jgi:hypothetical protein
MVIREVVNLVVRTPSSKEVLQDDAREMPAEYRLWKGRVWIKARYYVWGNKATKARFGFTGVAYGSSRMSGYYAKTC